MQTSTYPDDRNTQSYFGVAPSPAPFDFQYVVQGAPPTSSNVIISQNTSPGPSLSGQRVRRASTSRRSNAARTLGSLERFDEEEVDESGTLVVVSRSSDGIPPLSLPPHPLSSSMGPPQFMQAAAAAASSSASSSSRSVSASVEQKRNGYRRRPKSTSTVLPEPPGIWLPDKDEPMSTDETEGMRSARRYYASPAQISLSTLNLGWPLASGQSSSMFAPTPTSTDGQQPPPLPFIAFPSCPPSGLSVPTSVPGFSWGNSRTFEDAPLSSPLTAPPKKRISAPSSPVCGSGWDDTPWDETRPVKMTSSMHELPTALLSPVKRKRRASAGAQQLPSVAIRVSPRLSLLAHRDTETSDASSSSSSPRSPLSSSNDDQVDEDPMAIVTIEPIEHFRSPIRPSPRPSPRISPRIGFSPNTQAAAVASAASSVSCRPRDTAPVIRATVRLLPTFETVQRKILAAIEAAEVEAAALREAAAASSSVTTTTSSTTDGATASGAPNQSSKRMSAAQAPYYIVRENELLHEGKYKVVSILGKGSFGIVVKAEIASPAPDGRPTQVAIKIIRKGASFLAQGRREFKVLHYIHQNSQIRDEAHNFIVNAVETFFHDGHLCIVFELLSDTLFELLQRSWSAPATQQPGLSLRMVCKMAHQLLCALVTLRNLKVIHCDLKPENIALTSPNRPRIKILDFGSCCFASEEPCNQFPYIQSRYYRAPEVLLGTGYSCAIDVWSLGCIMVELFVGKPLFIGENAIQQLYRIIEVLGMPPESMLRRSAHLSKFFNRTPRGLEPTQNWPGRIDVGKNDLRKIITAKPEANQPQHVEFFLDLVTRMLKWDPTERISPLEALNHPFVRNGPRGAPNAASAAAAAAGSGAPQATQLAAPQQQQQQAHAAAAPIYAFPPPGAWTDRQR